MSKARTKPYGDMNLKELSEATKEFDEEFVIDRSRPLSKRERAVWNRAKGKGGRPRVGAGAEAVSVTIERTLLRDADRLALQLGLSRSQLIARGLRRLLKAG